MNQLSSIGFGPDATVFAGYAQSANDRLGNIDFVFENIGANTAYIKLAQYDGTTSPSGYAQIGDAFTVVAGGAITKSYVLLSKRVAFFGSGNTSVNISTVIRNKADLRGGQIDIVAVGRKGWGLDPGFDAPQLTKKWGSVPTVLTSGGNISAGAGTINPTGPNFDGTQNER
jgi:hypothetical protein